MYPVLQGAHEGVCVHMGTLNGVFVEEHIYLCLQKRCCFLTASLIPDKIHFLAEDHGRSHSRYRAFFPSVP